MKAAGIVRRIDDLGRVVIPKEIRRGLRIREGDPLEIFVDKEGEVILKKYSPIGELADFARDYCGSLYEVTGRSCAVTDREAVVASAGVLEQRFANRMSGLPPSLDRIMDGRRPVTLSPMTETAPSKDGETGQTPESLWDFGELAVAPIISDGDPVGAVIVASAENGTARIGEFEIKLAETAAGFMARQLQQ